MRKLNFLFCVLLCVCNMLTAQNVGIGTTTPTTILHVVSLADEPLLTLDANPMQSGSNPLIRLRNSTGDDLMWIHSNDPSNLFMGVDAGKLTSGLANIFLGQNSGQMNTIGNSNVAVGTSALF